MKVFRLGGQLPCFSPGKSLEKLNDGFISPWSSLALFAKGRHVNRFKSTILLPVKNLTEYQVGVVTSPQVECDDPVMVVMNDAGDYDESTGPQHQCSRVARYDAFNGKAKTCVFHCLNRKLNDLEVTATVQFNSRPWIDTTDYRIYEIEAYTFWKPMQHNTMCCDCGINSPRHLYAL